MPHSEQYHQQPNQDPGLVNLVELKIALDNSSDKNRNFLIAFLMLEIYLLVTILSTTDLNLFLADGVFAFPVIDIKISLVAFFILAPLILVAFHYNLLFNLLEHCKTLQDWLHHPENNRNENFNLLHAFMFNIRAKYNSYSDSERTINYYLLNAIIIFMVSLSPLVLLVMILWHFANFQNLWISALHLLLIVISLVLHVFYWLRIQNPALLATRYDEMKELYPALFSDRYMLFYLSVVLMVSFVRASALIFGLYGPITLSKYMDNPIINFIVPHIDIQGYKVQPLEKNDNPIITNNQTDSSDTLPGGIEPTTMEKCQNDEDYELTDLSHRHLRLANLSDVDICHIKLLKTDLRGARMRNSVFSGAFDMADLSAADLSHSQIQRYSSAVQAKFRHTNLSYALANQVNFTMADFTGATFWAAELMQSEFLQASLQHSTFALSQTHFSNFRSADFAHATFVQTDLNGVDLRFANNLDSSVTFDNSLIFDCYVDDVNVLKNLPMYQQANCDIYNSKLLKDDSPEQESIGQLRNRFKPNEATEHLEQGQNSQILIERIIAITKLSRAKQINLSNLGLSQIPRKVTALEQLEKINLSYNRLDAEQLLITTLLGGLKSLDFGSNNVDAVPVEIAQLSELSDLNLSGNRLITLPYAMNQLAGLTTLNLNDNQFTTLPAVVGQLSQLHHLTVQTNKLAELPAALGQLEQLQSLSFEENEISHLPAEIGQLNQLKILNLSFNELTSLPQSIGQLTQLSELNLSYNYLTTLPSQIGQLNQLPHLNLTGNSLTELPSEIAQLTRLTSLSLSFNQLTQLPVEIGLLNQLPKLNLDSNLLTEFPDEIIKLKQIIELNISDNLFTKFPTQISAFKQLQKLAIKGNELNHIPPLIGQLTALTELDLGGNLLNALPIEMVQLDQLNGLYLQGNLFTIFPEAIGQLRQLKRLALSGNQISEWPLENGQYTELTELDLGYNQFSSVPDKIGQLQKLQKLNLRSNHLNQLPASIGNLFQLTQLDLGHNQLIDLSFDTRQLSQLESLTLDGNQFTDVPTSIGLLKHLSKLNLANNRLTSLPQELNQLSQLKVLNLNGNNLTHLPEAIVELPLLESLDVRGNQLTTPPQKVADKGLGAILAWFANEH